MSIIYTLLLLAISEAGELHGPYSQALSVAHTNYDRSAVARANQPPARLNPGSAEAKSIDQVVSYLTRTYFAGISLDERQTKRLRQIVEYSLEEQKASMAGAKADQLDSLRVAHLRSRNAALRSILPREEDRARYDANLKRIGAP